MDHRTHFRQNSFFDCITTDTSRYDFLWFETQVSVLLMFLFRLLAVNFVKQRELKPTLLIPKNRKQATMSEHIICYLNFVNIWTITNFLKLTGKSS